MHGVLGDDMGPIIRTCRGCNKTMVLDDKGYCKQCARRRQTPTVNDLRKRPNLLDLEHELDELEDAIGRFY